MKKVEAMFNGDKINVTENRSVLHTALRNFQTRKFNNLDSINNLDSVDNLDSINQICFDGLNTIDHKTTKRTYIGLDYEDIE